MFFTATLYIVFSSSYSNFCFSSITVNSHLPAPIFFSTSNGINISLISPKTFLVSTLFAFNTKKSVAYIVLSVSDKCTVFSVYLPTMSFFSVFTDIKDLISSLLNSISKEVDFCPSFISVSFVNSNLSFAPDSFLNLSRYSNTLIMSKLHLKFSFSIETMLSVTRQR